MLIEVKARTFFEVRQGEKRERDLFRTHRIISINNISFPTEPPPFSEKFLKADNLLLLSFDDVEAGENTMSPAQAKAIADFACSDDSRPIIVHCTAGISRSGAVGAVLNWYFNRYLEDNEFAYQRFELCHPDLVPNAHVRRLLLNELQTRHENLKTMSQAICLRNMRKRMLYAINQKLGESIFANLEKYFAQFDCVSFSEKVVRGNLELLRYAEAKFLRAGCGFTHCNEKILVVDLPGNGQMRQIIKQMLRLAEPETCSFKDDDKIQDFFAPFEDAIKKRASEESSYLLKLLEKCPRDAVIYLLAQRQWKYCNLFSKYAIDHHAAQFDDCYAEYERQKIHQDT